MCLFFPLALSSPYCSLSPSLSQSPGVNRLKQSRGLSSSNLDLYSGNWENDQPWPYHVFPTLCPKAFTFNKSHTWQELSYPQGPVLLSEGSNSSALRRKTPFRNLLHFVKRMCFVLLCYSTHCYHNSYVTRYIWFGLMSLLHSQPESISTVVHYSQPATLNLKPSSLAEVIRVMWKTFNNGFYLCIKCKLKHVVWCERKIFLVFVNNVCFCFLCFFSLVFWEINGWNEKSQLCVFLTCIIIIVSRRCWTFTVSTCVYPAEKTMLGWILHCYGLEGLIQP